MSKKSASQPGASTSQRDHRHLTAWRLVFVIFSLTVLAAGITILPNAISKASAAREHSEEQISPNVLSEIEALMEEKLSRTPEQNKIDSNLLAALKVSRNQPVAVGAPMVQPDVQFEPDGRVLVDVDAKVTDTVLKQVEAIGGEIVSSFEKYDTIRARLTLAQIELLANLAEVKFIGRAVNGTLNSVSSDAAQQRSRPFAQPTISYPFSGRAARVRSGLPAVIAGLSRVKFTRRQDVAPYAGSVTSQGDVAHGAATARSTFNVNGAGVKIGVLSDSYNRLGGAPGDVATGDLPGPGNPNGFTIPVTVLQDLASGGTDEGRAMLQIVHDLAPGAQLYFATAFISPAGFATNIQALRNAGCDVIIDDVAYPNESPFQDAIVAQAVNTVTAAGALYFSSAGNSGNATDSTSGTWEGDFNDSGLDLIFGGNNLGRMHGFGSSTFNIVNPVPAGIVIRADLCWSDALGHSSNDYDLYISNGTSIIRTSNNIQNGTQDPYEAIGTLNVGERILITKKSGSSARFLHLDTGDGSLSISTNGRTRGHSSSVDAFSVAAVNVATASGGAFVGGSVNPIEAFSSDGPRRVFYKADGTAITPGNFSSTGGEVRQKPDIAAADGVVTTLPAGGLNPFFGTSAAAPHAGAIAALLRSYNPSLTPARIRRILTGTALDNMASGIDRDSGYGIVMALQALQSGDDDGADDFSLSANPNGVWTYGYSASRGSTFIPYTNSQANVYPGVDVWRSAPNTNIPGIFYNHTGATLDYNTTVRQPADELSLHPGTNGQNSVLRWTAPTAGNYFVAAQFEGIDTTGTTSDVAVLLNSSTLVNGDISSFGDTKAAFLRLTIQPGDKVDLSVGYGSNGNSNNDSTGLRISVRPDTTQTNNNITGHVRDGNSTGIGGVLMTLEGRVGTTLLERRTSLTNASGDYSFVNMDSGSTYTLTPLTPGYAFTPPSRVIANPSGSITIPDFVGVLPPVAYTFVGTGCNPQGDVHAWNNPCNWSPQSVPTANDTVTTGDHTINAGNVTVKGLTFNGGALNTGTITVTDAAIWSSGDLYATLRIGPAATLTITGGDKNISGLGVLGDATSVGILENQGTVNWMSTGRINCDWGGFVNNVYRGSIINSGTFVALNDQSLTFTGGSQGYFVNSGTVRKTTGSGDTTFNGVILRNNGTLDVQTGAISLRTGANELNDGTQITGAGRVRLDAARTITTGTISGNGTFESGGSPNTGAALEGTATFGGTLTFNWTGATIVGVPTIGQSATLLISGPDDKTITGFYVIDGTVGQGRLINAGTAIWTGTGRIICDNGGFINNVYRGSIINTGTFVALNDQSLTFTGGSQGYFVNSGTLRKTTGSGDTTFNGVILRNNGTLDVQTGAISLRTGANELNDGTQITGAGRVRLDAARTITTGTISGNGTFESGGSPNTGAALEGTATFGGTLTFNWTGATIVGVPTIGQSATLLISGPDDKTITGFYVIDGTVGQGRLINGGTAIWTGSGRILSNFGGFTNNSYSGSIINNGTFRVENDSSLILAPGSTTVGYFVNNGVFNKVAGSGTTTVSVPFNNDGTLAVQIGSVNLGRGGNSHGNFNPTADTSINFTGFIHSIFDGAMFTGGGRSRVSGGAGSFEFATATVASGSTFEIATGGELTGVGGFGGSGTVNWTGGLISGATTIGPSATLIISGADDKAISGLGSGGDGTKPGRLTNTGTAIWTGAGRVFLDWGGPENGYHGAIVNNGIFRAENDSSLIHSPSANIGYFVNNGTFMKSSSIGTTSLNINFVQSGTITLASGILNLGQGFNPTASSILNLSVGGTTPGAGFAQLNTASSATLDGALNVNLVNNFSPAIGSNFPLLLYGSHTGSFTQVNTPNINWRTFSTHYNSGDFTLQVGAPPTYTVPTPVGTNVRVTGGGVALVFDNVTGSTSPQGGKTPLTGMTTITPIDPNSVGPPPSGFIITQDSIAYDITTTATYTGTIRVDIPLTSNLQSIRPQLGLLHGESGSLVDRTIPTNILLTISARVTSLSPFVVAQTAGCVTSLVPTGQATGSPAVQSFAGNGGSGSITVNSPVDCNWTASTSDNWITITSGTGGTGNGTVSYSVAVNSGGTIRSGSIVISGQRFTILQGINFIDVPSTDLFYDVIGRLSAHGVTVGCGGGNYCPSDPVTREQMAAFIIRALGDFSPPAPATQRFNDVPASNPFYSFIDEMAARQITLGCGAGNYCPASPVLREQMAAFLIRGLGEFSPPTPATQRFTDVPPQNVFYNFIDRMAVLQITLGCTPDHSQYCPSDPVTRAQMAAFLVRAFKL